MKTLLICGTAAAALIGLAPAVAQTVSGAQSPRPAMQERMAKVHSRADVQARVAEHFTRVDTNRDGFVTKAEAEAARTQMRGMMREHMTERHAQMFTMMDSNRDGSISRAEWDAAHARRMTRRGGHAGDGGKAMHRGARGVSMGMMMHGGMFDMADADKDGRVSLQEAQAMALRHFDMADTNRDGQVTPDERRQMRQRMMNERRPG